MHLNRHPTLSTIGGAAIATQSHYISGCQCRKQNTRTVAQGEIHFLLMDAIFLNKQI